ncbi:MAG: Rieske (2Fe-2S) protein [Candidatus Binatia bacterium]
MNTEITSCEERAEGRWRNGKTSWRTVDLGPVDFLPLGEGRAYVVNGLMIAVFRQRDGRLFATDNSCPHRGGPLADGIIGAGKLICPLHAWKFDLETGHCAAENMTIHTYPVHEVDGHIIVDLP